MAGAQLITGNLADEETARFLAEVKVKVVGKPFSVSRILEGVNDALRASLPTADANRRA